MTSEHSVRSVLLRSRLVGGLPNDLVDAIVAAARQAAFAKGRLLFSQGEAGDAFYGIIAGRIRITAASIEGKELHFIELGPGDTFGEIALIDGGPRTASAVAVSPVRVFVIDRGRFLALLEKQPRLALHLLTRLCERLRWTSELAEDLSFLDVPAQIAKRIVLLARRFGTPCDGGLSIEMPQAELAAFLGVSRQAVNTHLQTWRQAGWLEVSRGRIVIRDADSLTAVSMAGH